MPQIFLDLLFVLNPRDSQLTILNRRSTTWDAFNNDPSIHPTIPFEQHLPSLHYPVRKRVYPWGRSSLREFLPSRTNGSRVALIRHNVSSLFFFFPLSVIWRTRTQLYRLLNSRFLERAAGDRKRAIHRRKIKWIKKGEEGRERGGLDA